MNKTLRSLLLCASLGALPFAAAQAAEGPTLRLATEGAYPPFNYYTADGQLAGFDIEIGTAITDQRFKLRLEAQSNQTYGRGFMALQPAERTAFINQLDKDARAAVAKGDVHYFTMIKQLTLFGFFSSEVGGTQVLRHIAIPGRYDGALAYKPGDRAWATR